MSSLVPLSTLALALVALALGEFLGLRGAVIALCFIGVCVLVWLLMSDSSRPATLFVGPFLLPLLAAGAAAGLASVAFLKRRMFIVALLPIVVLIYFVWSVHSQESDEAAVLKGALDFVSSQPQLRLRFGKWDRRSMISYTKGRDGKVTRLEYELDSTPATYVIIDVDRSAGALRYTIACVTSLYMGERDPSKNACMQGRTESAPSK